MRVKPKKLPQEHEWGFSAIRSRDLDRSYNPDIGMLECNLLLQELWVIVGREHGCPKWTELKPHYRDWLLNPKKDRRQRFNLFLHLWKNGVEARYCVYWVMWHNTYDKPAWTNMLEAANFTVYEEAVSKLDAYKTWIYEANDFHTTRPRDSEPVQEGHLSDYAQYLEEISAPTSGPSSNQRSWDISRWPPESVSENEPRISRNTRVRWSTGDDGIPLWQYNI